jgi:hypothetical protein
MSMVPIIQKLVRDDKLVPYYSSVVRPVNPQGPRFLWLTPEAKEWCLPLEVHPDSRISDEALAHLGDQFNTFVAGDFMDYEGVDMRRLCPPTKDIWEIKSYLKKPQLRVLGWFALPKLFVASHFAVREDLELGKGPKWNRIIAETETKRIELVGHVSHYHDDPGEYVKNPK